MQYAAIPVDQGRPSMLYESRWKDENRIGLLAISPLLLFLFLPLFALLEFSLLFFLS